MFKDHNFSIKIKQTNEKTIQNNSNVSFSFFVYSFRLRKPPQSFTILMALLARFSNMLAPVQKWNFSLPVNLLRSHFKYTLYAERKPSKVVANFYELLTE